MPDFQLARSDFERQTHLLESLFSAVNIVAQQDPNAPVSVGALRLPIISSEGQNTMGAAAIVLLAAHFEEYVRIQAGEFASAIVAEYSFWDDGLRNRLIDAYWQAGSNRLGKIRPKNDPGWSANAERMLNNLIAYPVQDNIAEFVAQVLCDHENNMRWDTISQIMSRVGVRELSHKLHRFGALKDELGNPKKDELAARLSARLNDFFDLRNGIIHAIAQTSGVGETILLNWTLFFRVLSQALAEALNMSFGEFCRDVEKRKAVVRS